MKNLFTFRTAFCLLAFAAVIYYTHSDLPLFGLVIGAIWLYTPPPLDRKHMIARLKNKVVEQFPGTDFEASVKLIHHQEKPVWACAVWNPRVDQSPVDNIFYYDYTTGREIKKSAMSADTQSAPTSTTQQPLDEANINCRV